MGLLKTFTEIFDRLWEDYIYDPATKLYDIFDPQKIDARWLPYVLPMVGFTADLSFDATAAEMRKMAAGAMDFWNERPAELGVINDAIRLVTGNRFTVADYYNLQIELDRSYLTEELTGFDSVVVGFPSSIWMGDRLAYNQSNPGEFEIGDMPSGYPQFSSADQFAYLVITKDFAQPTNEKIYKLEWLTKGSNTGKIVGGAFPAVHAGNAHWQLYGYMGEFVTEVRLVDEAVGTLYFQDEATAFVVTETVYGEDSGARGVITAIDRSGTEGSFSLRNVVGRFTSGEALTGSTAGEATVRGKLQDALNRDLIRFLMDLARLNNERIDIVYVAFIDQFQTPNDLDQWQQLPDTDGVEILSPAGPAQFSNGYYLIDADSQSQYWGDQVIAWRIVADTATSVVDLIFFAVDEDDHYFARVDYSAKTVRLYKNVAGSPTALSSAISIPYIKYGVQDLIRVDALAEGTGTRIRVHVDGELKVDYLDDPATRTAGKVGAYANTSTFQLEYVEVNVLPAEVERVGPQP